MQAKFHGFGDRTAVVTGSARGIGRSIADALVSQGSRTAYLDVRKPDAFHALSDDPNKHFVECDITDETSIDAAFSEVEATWGPVSILVNNAGVLFSATIRETTLEMWRKTLDVNLTGAFLASRRALPGMQQARYGRIVNVGSSAGKTGGSREVGAYAASKAGIMCLAKSIASEHAQDGITSNAVAPALIGTDMIADLSDLAERIPVGRLGLTDDVTYAVLFLASEEAGYITGEVMDVNGGFVID